MKKENLQHALSYVFIEEGLDYGRCSMPIRLHFQG